MLKIWGRKNSSNVRKALWIAEEVGVPYETQDAGGAFGLVNEAACELSSVDGFAREWEQLGKLYETKLLLEAQDSSGSIDFTTAKVVVK